MSGAHPTVICPRCGMKLMEYDRSHRLIWQWILFRNSRRYQCNNCGKRTFIANINAYMAKPEHPNTA